jgi:hypothetical protein
MTKSMLTVLYTAFLLTTGPLLAQPASPLRVTLTKFEAQNVSIPDAVLKAGQQSGVPIGLDASDPTLWKSRVSVMKTNATLGEVLRQILDAGPAYTIAQDGRAVVIRPVLQPSNLLNTRILLFKTEKPASADDLSFKLWMTLVRQLDPRRAGFMGGGLANLDSTLEKAVLPPVDLSGKTVWEILDWIVGTHGSAAWVAVPFGGEVGDSPANSIWHLEPYSDPGTSQR